MGQIKWAKFVKILKIGLNESNWAQVCFMELTEKLKLTILSKTMQTLCVVEGNQIS